jgi:hypothetical protein
MTGVPSTPVVSIVRDVLKVSLRVIGLAPATGRAPRITPKTVTPTIPVRSRANRTSASW